MHIPHTDNHTLQTTLAAIAPVETSLAEAAQAHLDNLTKPRCSLGRLEELAVQLACMNHGTVCAHPARIYTVAGDHGVAAQGVSLFPQEVTRQMVLNFCNGGAAINVLTRTHHIDLKVVDAGVAGEGFPEHPNLIQHKIAPGTADLCAGPAMTRPQTEAALALGIELAQAARDDGYRALGTGDMGIANTTPSTALYCAYLGLAPEAITGPGTGLPADGVAHKASVITRALTVNQHTIAHGDAIDTLAALGGFEIATLAGLVLGAARLRMPIAIDGFISTAAYVAAAAICPHVAGYAVLSHASAEPGHAHACHKLGLKPLLDLSMRLGEGTGAALALTLLHSAAAIYNDMASFSDAGVSEA